ncbi:MAG: hypothetical protein IIT73_07155, partial [Treponema sp.]|nr:hypothetical protein [Treponema sp.]
VLASRNQNVKIKMPTAKTIVLLHYKLSVSKLGFLSRELNIENCKLNLDGTADSSTILFFG